METYAEASALSPNDWVSVGGMEMGMVGGEGGGGKIGIGLLSLGGRGGHNWTQLNLSFFGGGGVVKIGHNSIFLLFWWGGEGVGLHKKQ